MQQGGWRRPHNGISEVSTAGTLQAVGTALGPAETGSTESSQGGTARGLRNRGCYLEPSSGSSDLVPNFSMVRVVLSLLMFTVFF